MTRRPSAVAGGLPLRQALTPGAADQPQGLATPVLSAIGIPPALLTDEQGAALYGVGLRTFLELQSQPWFPVPRILGPRMKRHVATELLAAIEKMPRQESRSEPAQLLRARIDRLKSAGGTAPGAPRDRKQVT